MPAIMFWKIWKFPGSFWKTVKIHKTGNTGKFGKKPKNSTKLTWKTDKCRNWEIRETGKCRYISKILEIGVVPENPDNALNLVYWEIPVPKFLRIRLFLKKTDFSANFGIPENAALSGNRCFPRNSSLSVNSVFFRKCPKNFGFRFTGKSVLFLRNPAPWTECRLPNFVLHPSNIIYL